MEAAVGPQPGSEGHNRENQETLLLLFLPFMADRAFRWWYNSSYCFPWEILSSGKQTEGWFVMNRGGWDSVRL